LTVSERIVECDAEAVERRRQPEELLLAVELEAEDFAGIGIVGGYQDQFAELTSFEHLVFQFRETGEDGLVDVLIEDTGREYATRLEVPLERKVHVHGFERLEIRVALLGLALEYVRIVF